MQRQHRSSMRYLDLHVELPDWGTTHISAKTFTKGWSLVVVLPISIDRGGFLTFFAPPLPSWKRSQAACKSRGRGLYRPS